MKRPMAALAVTILLLTAVGCGSDDGSDKSDGSAATPTSTAAAGEDDSGGVQDDGSDDVGAIDACALLAADEVAAALGEPATPTDQSTGQMYGCSGKGDSDAINSLSISEYVHPDAATAKEMYDATKEGLDGSDIMGLGDEASYNESFGLEVLHGRYDISVDNTGPTEKESDLAIAKRIIENLP